MKGGTCVVVVMVDACNAATHLRSDVCMRDVPSYGTRCMRRTSKRTLRNERDDYESVIGCTGKVLVPTYSSHSTTCTQQGVGVSVGYRGRVWSGGWFVSILRTVPWIWK
jgi:hypothetical protein